MNHQKNNRIKNIVYQIFDNIFWNFDIIKQISFNNKENKKLSDELVNKIINMKYINNGLYYKTHLLLTLYDIIVHDNQYFINQCENLVNNRINLDKFKNIMKKMYHKLYKQVYSHDDDNYLINLNSNLILPFIINHLNSDKSSLYFLNILDEIYAADIYYCIFENNDINKFINFKNNVLKNTNKDINYLLDKIKGNNNIDYKKFIKVKIKNNIDNNMNSIFESPKSNIFLNKKECLTIISEESFSDDEFIKTSNKFTEDILYNDLENNTISTVFSDDQHINQFTEDYLSENTETLKRYNKIFAKNH